MHSRTKTQSVLSLVIVLVCFTFSATAQQLKKQGDNKSHRFLPPGARPSKDALKTPEYLEALEQYRKLRPDRQSRSSEPLPFDPGQFNPGQLDPGQLDPGQFNPGQFDLGTETPQIDPELFEQLSPEERRWLRKRSRNSMSDVAKEIGRDVVELNQRFRQQFGFGGDEPEPSKRFELPDDVLSPYERARKMWSEQTKQLNDRYKQELEKHYDQWPSGRIPPEQWLNKVQPYINSEVIEQLRQYRAFQEGSTDKLPESAFEKLQKPDSPNRGISGRMLESMVKTLDSGANELIKRAKENKRAGKKQSSVMKRLKELANKQLKSANKAIVDRTEQYATAPAIKRPQPRSRVSTSSNSSNTTLAKIFGAVAFVLGIAALIAYLLHLKSVNRSDNDYAAPIDTASICDRESLLRAIHLAAADRFGRSSRYWHHRKLFSEIKELSKTRRSDDLPVLARLYERARYAPNSKVTNEELEIARRWYEDFRNADLVKS